MTIEKNDGHTWVRTKDPLIESEENQWLLEFQTRLTEVLILRRAAAHLCTGVQNGVRRALEQIGGCERG